MIIKYEANKIASTLVQADYKDYINNMKRIFEMFKKNPLVSVVSLDGVIGGKSRFGGETLNDDSLAPLLEKAFRKGKPVAVALKLNSPGGSPVQSSLIGARIRRLSEETKVPVYAFCEDVAASGGYWLACAADEIYLDSSSIIGSIGVISASFGFQDLLEKQGIERRVHTAGKDKSMGDPFRAEKPADVERIKALQKTIHDNFINHVKDRRGDKLDQSDLFTGEIWVGQDAIDLGLADNIGHLIPTMKTMFGDDVKFGIHGKKKSLLSKFGISGPSDIIASVEERSIWARYGL